MSLTPLTPQEFNTRMEVINRAMAIYGEQTGYNITKALELLNEPDFEINLPASKFKGIAGNILDKYIRPRCPYCNSEMQIRILPENDEGINSQLVCSWEECDTVLDSELTIDKWLDILDKKHDT